MPEFSKRLVSLIVFELDRAIRVHRAGYPPGLAALEPISVGTKVEADVDRSRQLPSTLSDAELSVLSVLAEVYGPILLTSAPLGYALRLIADRGAERLVQRVLWGETPCDGRLAVLLDEATEPFAHLASAWPEVFMAEADIAIARFRTRPPDVS